MTRSTMSPLAIEGGPKAFDRPFPSRHLIGEAEKRAAMAVFDRAIETGEPIGYNGEEEEEYCSRFADFMGGGYCDAVNSGSSAVYVALRALEIPAFSEVVVSPITDAGGIMPVALTNCIPVVADTNLHSYNTGPEQIEARITERTRAIIVAHITGIPVDMDPIMEIARSHDIRVLEDCSQAHGSRYKGRLVGTIGDVTAFSTMDGKHHCTGPQGGVVFTKDPEMAMRCRRLSDRGKPFGIKGIETNDIGISQNVPVSNVVASLNLNSNNLAAAIGLEQLGKLPRIIEDRRRIARAIAEGIEDRCPSIRFVGDPAECESAYWFLVFDLDTARVRVSKQQFAEAIAAEGLPVAASYVPPQSHWRWFRTRTVFGEQGLPWTAPQFAGDPDRPMPLPNFETMDERLFRMDYHENLADADVDDIISVFEKVGRAYGGEA
ncbi:MAG: hypothetical protein CMJ18_06105 [Phycisphaeraceae bacterium]|nr:hypothetical protein [Phycisphaeraceae bacterium]